MYVGVPSPVVRPDLLALLVVIRSYGVFHEKISVFSCFTFVNGRPN